MLESLFDKVAGPQACNFIQKRYVISSEICEIFKDAYFAEHLRTTAFDDNI